MNYKNIIMGIVFYIMISGIEKALCLKTFSLLIPATIAVIAVWTFVQHKMKKISE